MHIECMMVADHVTIVGSFEFTFCSAESYVELPLKWAKFAPNNTVIC